MIRTPFAPVSLKIQFPLLAAWLCWTPSTSLSETVFHTGIWSIFHFSIYSIFKYNSESDSSLVCLKITPVIYPSHYIFYKTPSYLCTEDRHRSNVKIISSVLLPAIQHFHIFATLFPPLSLYCMSIIIQTIVTYFSQSANQGMKCYSPNRAINSHAYSYSPLLCLPLVSNLWPAVTDSRSNWVRSIDREKFVRLLFYFVWNSTDKARLDPRLILLMVNILFRWDHCVEESLRDSN